MRRISRSGWLRALSVRGRHRKTVHPSVGPNRASIPSCCFSTAQESDSCSNVSLSGRVFQQPAKDDPEEDANETSPPYILASSRGCYRADVPLSWTDLRSDRVLRDAISRTRGHHHRMESNRSNNSRAGSTPHRSADSSVGDAPCRNVRGGQLD